MAGNEISILITDALSVELSSTGQALYEPFARIQLFSNSVSNYLRNIAIGKIRQASALVADEVNLLIRSVRKEDLSVHM